MTSISQESERRGERNAETRTIAWLRQVRAKGTEAVYSVIGAGHGGLAMAGHLGILGYPVKLYNRTDEKLDGVRWHGGVKVSGAVSGFGPVRTATSDMHEAVEGAEVIMVVTPSTAHRNLASVMAPFLKDGQLIVLNPGRTGGALEFRKVFRDSGMNASVIIAETQTFLYASRAVSRWEAYVFRVKNAVPFATLPSFWIPEALGILNAPFPQFVAGSDVLATSLENIGAVFHPALTIMNAGLDRGDARRLRVLPAGHHPRCGEAAGAHRCRTPRGRLRGGHAERLGARVAVPQLRLARKDLYEAMLNTGSYRGIKAPPSIDHRYISEDVPMSLVPLSSLGSMLGVPTPAIDMIIQLGSILHATDYRAVGRTVESLGLAGLSVKQIRQHGCRRGPPGPPEGSMTCRNPSHRSALSSAHSPPG